MITPMMTPPPAMMLQPMLQPMSTGYFQVSSTALHVTSHIVQQPQRRGVKARLANGLEIYFEE